MASYGEHGEHCSQPGSYKGQVWQKKRSVTMATLRSRVLVFTADYYNWTASDQGESVRYGVEEGDYSTGQPFTHGSLFCCKHGHGVRCMLHSFIILAALFLQTF